MRVAADHDLKARGFRIEVEPFQIVQDIDTGFRQLNDNVFWKGLAPRLGVYIAAHGMDPCGVLELAQDGAIAYIAGMNDRLRATKRSDRLGPKQTVRVGDQAKDKGLHH